MTISDQMQSRALALNIPLSVHMDLTYRCNERCIHCYLDHNDYGEMTTAEILDVISQLAEANVFYLILSGGEIMMRRDFFEIVEHARSLQFCVKLKTNGVMIRESEAQRLRKLGVQEVQISVYSHRPEVHDRITKLPGSFRRTVDSIRFLVAQGMHVIVANVLMNGNTEDHLGVRELAVGLGAQCTVDPTITPMMDGDMQVVDDLRISTDTLAQVFRTGELVGNVEEFCAPPLPPGADDMDSIPCSAGHTACYITPYGDVYPCVQFPLPSGNVRKQRFIDIWRHSDQLNEVRDIHLRDLSTCSTCSHGATCSRCPGLAFTEGNMRGPSTADCEKSFYRTGVATANMIARGLSTPVRSKFVQISPLVPAN